MSKQTKIQELFQVNKDDLINMFGIASQAKDVQVDLGKDMVLINLHVSCLKFVMPPHSNGSIFHFMDMKDFECLPPDDEGRLFYKILYKFNMQEAKDKIVEVRLEKSNLEYLKLGLMIDVIPDKWKQYAQGLLIEKMAKSKAA